MKEKIVNRIMLEMNNFMDRNTKNILLGVLTTVFDDVDIVAKETALSTTFVSNEFYEEMYLAVKQLAGCQQTTLRQYKYEIDRFFEKVRCDIPRCDTNLIRKYLLDYQKVASNTTVDNVRRYLRAFFQFLEDESYIEKNPVKPIPKIKDEDKTTKFFDDYAIEQLRDNCKNPRELALIDMLLSTGLRVHEVPKIKLSDIDWNNRIITVHGKGGKDRIVPFSTRASKHMYEYISSRQQDSQYLFCRTKSPCNIQGSKAMIAALFKKVSNRAGVNDITIHGVRRWVASSMNDKGADIGVIQDILGHAEFSTTKKYYLNKNIKRITQVHELYSV